MSLTDCKIIEIPKITDRRGNLSFIEGGHHIPFNIKRVYYLYDLPGGASRGAHAHVALHQFMISAAGSFDVTIDDGNKIRNFHLNSSYQGLYIPPMMWRNLTKFSTNSICLVLASECYDEKDYIRNYEEFVRRVQSSL
jgi:hypothetical protein